MPILVPGLNFTESAVAVASAVNADRLNKVIILTTRAASPPIGSVAEGVLTTNVASTAEISTKVGTVPTVVLQSYRLIKDLYPSAIVHFLPWDTGATVSAKLNSAAAAIPTAALELNFALVIVPESFSFTTDAEEQSLYTALETALKPWNWIYFHNFREGVDTKAKADTIDALLTGSTNGHGSKFYGGGTYNSVLVPLAAAAAGLMLKNSQEEPSFSNPTGIIPLTIPAKFRLTYAEATDALENKFYNYPYYVEGWQIWNCSTGAPKGTDGQHSVFRDINRRLAVSTLQSRLLPAGSTRMFKPYQLNVEPSLQFVRLFSIVSAFDDEGGFSYPPDASTDTGKYDISIRRNADNSAVITISGYFISSLRKISVNIALN